MGKVEIAPASMYALYRKLIPTLKWFYGFKIYVKKWQGPAWSSYDYMIEATAKTKLADAKGRVDGWANAFSQSDNIAILHAAVLNDLEPCRKLLGVSWVELKEYQTPGQKWDVYD